MVSHQCSEPFPIEQLGRFAKAGCFIGVWGVETCGFCAKLLILLLFGNV